ncbi:tetratricopeptide repeat protein, partial [Actinomadura rubrisoli]
MAVRAGLYQALYQAFTESGIPWESCYREDRGDGALILVPPSIPKERLAGPLPLRLATLLERHNRQAGHGARIRLRAAVHAGEVHHDDHGVAGTAINTAFRLLDAGPLKHALRRSSGTLALIASDWFYREVVWQSPTCNSDAYRPVPVAVKEMQTKAWIRLPGTREPETERIVRLLALHPGAEISVPAAAALLDLPADRARALLGSLALGEPAPGRYLVPDHTAEPGHADKPGHAAEPGHAAGKDAEGTAAVRRVLAWYLGTADSARRILCPDRVTASLTLLDAPCRPLTFASAAEAQRWCEAERLNLIAAARLAAEDGHHDIAWRLPLALWRFFFLRSPWTDWIEALRTGPDSARCPGDERGVAYALGGLGYVSQSRWRFEESANFFRAARDLFVQVGDRRGEAWALHGLGYACRRLRRFSEAIELHERSLGLSRAVGDQRSIAWALNALGYTHAGLREFSASLDRFQQAHAVARHTERRAQGWALHGLGYAHHGLGLLPPAIDHYRQALDVFSEIGDRAGRGEALYNLGRAHLSAERPDAARDSWVRALTIFEDLQSPQSTGVLARLRSLDTPQLPEPPD